MQYINWIYSSHWTSRVILGENGDYYNFSADWNTRDESWAVTISTTEGSVVIQNRKMVLNIDLLNLCYSPLAPKCWLYPATDNENIQRITYDNMVSGDVKLFHIVQEDLDEQLL